MMPETQSLLLSLARDSRRAAELLSDAVCRGCRTCIAEISDLNRHTLFELAEAERRALRGESLEGGLHIAHLLGGCVSRAFSAALLFSQELPKPAPLCEIVSCHSELAVCAEKLLSDSTPPYPYSIHLCANKARGAHALLLTNCTTHENLPQILPFAMALEAHRNALTCVCEALMERP